tara:strand:+ start:921 stop:1448 length:528 start_codon:yes stop_codon:yes gene_type:complete
MNSNILLMCDYYSMVPILIYFSGFYAGIYLEKIYEVILFICFILINDYITKIIKGLPYPEFLWSITRRPEGAFNTDYFSRNGKALKNAPGFPSGHMTSITSFCIYMILRKKGNTLWLDFIKKNYMFILFNLLLICLMGFARWYKKCHNLFQIIGGIIYGSITSYLYFEYIGKYFI